ncbi:hypothetical protein FOA52_010830 [Chlamydomonas sp. UWO 241]|nr:hypothetical protein FOA52_010830 [Chlamydomonas sp. UWO 241]
MMPPWACRSPCGALAQGGPNLIAWPIRRVFRVIWIILCTLTFLALPLTVWEFSRVGYDIHYQGWFFGGLFVIMSIPISIYEVALHTEHYTRPRLQRYIIRILWMVPIYGVDAWLALRFRDAREYLDPLRECYEAFVIYSFYAYLMAYLEDTVGDLDEHMSKKPPMQHLSFIRWFAPPWQMGQQFMTECKKGVLTYVIIRPVCTGIGFVTDLLFVLSIPVARGANWFLAGGGRRMDEEEATAAAAERIAAASEDGTSLPVRLATDVVRFLYGGTGRREPADGGVVSASLLNAKPAVGGIGVEPRGGGVLRVLFTVASDAVADTVVRWRHELRRCVDSTAVFDVLSDREEAQHQAMWPAFLAAKVAGKRAQFHRACLVVDGERVPAPAC